MVLAIILSFLSGVSIVVARTINAKLAAETNDYFSTFYNYAVGLVCTLIVLFACGYSVSSLSAHVPVNQLWAYLGGVVGVLVITFSNITVMQISSFSMTLLLFLGQVTTGIVIDMIISHKFSLSNVLGGLLVGVGLAINTMLERNSASAKEKTDD